MSAARRGGAEAYAKLAARRQDGKRRRRGEGVGKHRVRAPTVPPCDRQKGQRGHTRTKWSARWGRSNRQRVGDLHHPGCPRRRDEGVCTVMCTAVCLSDCVRMHLARSPGPLARISAVLHVHVIVCPTARKCVALSCRAGVPPETEACGTARITRLSAPRPRDALRKRSTMRPLRR